MRVCVCERAMVICKHVDDDDDVINREVCSRK